MASDMDAEKIEKLFMDMTPEESTNSDTMSLPYVD